jgi:pimeloyl-ACP methyl ester carboxylesterase
VLQSTNARFDCPTLVGVGELDPVTPVAAAREIVDALPRGSARLEVTEGAGHFTWKDAPTATGRRARVRDGHGGDELRGRVATLGWLAASAREIGE